MTSSERRWGGRVLIAFGVIVLLAVVVLYFWGIITGRHVDVPPIVIAIGMIFGFVGFFMEDPNASKDGGNFLVTTAERLARVIPLGRRKTDPAIVIPPPTDPPTGGGP